MKKNTLNTLLAAASLLPGINAQAELPLESKFSYRMSQYQESDLPAAASSTNQAVERYQIDVHQLSLEHPIDDKSSVNVAYQYETLSGASPWYNAENAQGQVQAVMSGASIKEERYDVSSRYARHFDNLSAGVSLGVSSEYDYEATYFGGDLEWRLNQKNTTLSVSFSTSDDTLEPTYSGRSGLSLLNTSNPVPLYNDETSRNDPDYCSTNTQTKQPQYCRVGNDKSSLTYAFGLSQVMTPTRMLLWSYGRTDLEGFLSDPYKLDDYRPDSKEQAVMRLGLREFFPDFSGALHLDYRHYEDNWGVESHTLKVGWAQNYKQFLIVPSLRYYQQDAAFFYRPQIGLNTNTFFSNDARLSAFHALGYKIKGMLSTSLFNYHASFELYSASASGGTVPNPGLIDYTRFTFGLDYLF